MHAFPLDDALRDAVNSLPFALFRDAERGSFRWYYAEDEVYVVQHETEDGGGTYLIVKASSPDEAVRKDAEWTFARSEPPDPRRVLGSALRDTSVDCGGCGEECPRRSEEGEGVSMYDCPKFSAMRDAADGKDDDDRNEDINVKKEKNT